jgi:hypothetical protein
MKVKRQFNKWLDIFLVTKDATITFFCDLITFVRDYDCEGDIDGEGGLGCPECLEVIEVGG